MANNVKNTKMVTPDNCPELAAALAMNEAIIGHHNFQDVIGDDTEDEKLELKQISLPKEDLILFSKVPYSQTDMIQVSELQNQVFGLFKDIFYDVFNVKFTFDTQRGYLFIVSFRYMTDEQINALDSDDKLIRAITSSVNPEDAETKNSVAANLMMMVKQQTISSYDASKYAKITKEAKELLTNLLFFSQNNKKHKWVKGENYTLTTQTGAGFAGGRTFTNIVASVFLDAEKVLNSTCAIPEDNGKFEYAIVPKANNITNTDSLLKIEKINKQRKNQIRNKYGVQFN